MLFSQFFHSHNNPAPKQESHPSIIHMKSTCQVYRIIDNLTIQIEKYRIELRLISLSHSEIKRFDLLLLNKLKTLCICTDVCMYLYMYVCVSVSVYIYTYIFIYIFSLSVSVFVCTRSRMYASGGIKNCAEYNIYIYVFDTLTSHPILPIYNQLFT